MTYKTDESGSSITQTLPNRVNRTVPNVANFLMSGTAAIISKTASAPVERVKLLIQNQNELIKSNRLDRAYASVPDCIKRLLINEGYRSLWRGNLTNCIRYFNYQALNFTLKEKIKFKFKFRNDGTLVSIIGTHIIIGGFAGLCSGTLLYSLDYTRTRLANDIIFKTTKRQFTGIVDVYMKTLKSDGIIGLYRGFLITCVTIIMYRGLYFGLYDSMKILYPEVMNRSYLNKFIVGFMVSATSSVIVYPMDTIRRRMMMTSIGAESIKYKGNIDCIKYIMRNEGFKSFYKGCGVNMVRGFCGAGTLVGFDLFQSLYVRYNQ